MMKISPTEIQKLRQKTNAGMMDCKEALQESKGNFDKAVEYLRKKGKEIASQKSEREVKEGTIGVYLHSNKKVAVLVEVFCETDFVARNEELQDFAKDLAMQIAANNPSYLNPEDVPEEVLAKEREIYLAQVKEEGKPPAIQKKIVEGKLNKYKEEVSLITQPFFKDPKKTIKDLLTEKIAKLGENIQIGEFVRFSLK